MKNFLPLNLLTLLFFYQLHGMDADSYPLDFSQSTPHTYTTVLQSVGEGPYLSYFQEKFPRPQAKIIAAIVSRNPRLRNVFTIKTFLDRFKKPTTVFQEVSHCCFNYHTPESCPHSFATNEAIAQFQDFLKQKQTIVRQTCPQLFPGDQPLSIVYSAYHRDVYGFKDPEYTAALMTSHLVLTDLQELQTIIPSMVQENRETLRSIAQLLAQRKTTPNLCLEQQITTLTEQLICKNKTVKCLYKKFLHFNPEEIGGAKIRYLLAFKALKEEAGCNYIDLPLPLTQEFIQETAAAQPRQ